MGEVGPWRPRWVGGWWKGNKEAAFPDSLYTRHGVMENAPTLTAVTGFPPGAGAPDTTGTSRGISRNRP